MLPPVDNIRGSREHSLIISFGRRAAILAPECLTVLVRFPLLVHMRFGITLARPYASGRLLHQCCFRLACGDASAVSHKSPTGVAVVIFFFSFDSSIVRSHLRTQR